MGGKVSSSFFAVYIGLTSFLYSKNANTRALVFDYFQQKASQHIKPKELQEFIKESLKGFVSNLSQEQLNFARIDTTQFQEDIENIVDNYSNPQYDSVHQQVNQTITNLLQNKNTRYDAIGGAIRPFSPHIPFEEDTEKNCYSSNQNGSSENNQPGEQQPGQQGGEQQEQDDTQQGEQQGEQQPGQPGQPGGEQQPGQSGQQGGEQQGGEQQGGEQQGGEQQGGEQQPGQQGGEQQEQDDTQQGLSNTENAIINLSEILEEDERDDLLTSVSNQGGTQGGEASTNSRLVAIAQDQYYKKNVSPIELVSTEYDSVRQDLGKRFRYKRIGETIVNKKDLLKLNLTEISKFQREVGLPMLIPLPNQVAYRYIEYEPYETEEIGVSREQKGLILPDNLIIHVDSSGSMDASNYVGTGKPYDTLMHVVYGILKTLKEEATEERKEISVTTVNFSNTTQLSKPVEIQEMYDTFNNSAKNVLASPQNGGTTYDASVFQQIDENLEKGKTAHIFVTDGELHNGEPTIKAIEGLAQNKDTSFLYFEIGGYNSSTGEAIRKLSQRHHNVQYHPNVNIEEIKDKALEVLLEYA